MKKVITMMAVVAVAAVATADLSNFDFTAGVLTDNASDTYAFGQLTDAALVQLIDLNAFVSGGQINLANIPAAFAIGNIGVAPPMLGGTYTSDPFSERPSTVIGQTAWLVFDPNGGGIEVGDFIGLSSMGAEILDMAAAGDPAPTEAQHMALGDIQANIEVVIPEPATFGLMGLAGLGMFLARKKARR